MALAKRSNTPYTIPGHGTDTVHNTDTSQRPASLGVNQDNGNTVGPPLMPPGITPKPDC